MTRPFALALAALLLAACATPPPQPATTLERRHTRIEVGGTVYTVELTRTREAWVTTLPVATDRVWAAVPGTYERLGLTGGGLVQPGIRAYGFRGRFPRLLSGRRPSAYLDCGRGLAGPNADRYEVRMSIATTVEPEGEASRVRTFVDASATPRDVSGGALPCSTTGELERTIVEALGHSTAG